MKGFLLTIFLLAFAGIASADYFHNLVITKDAHNPEAVDLDYDIPVHQVTTYNGWMGQVNSGQAYTDAQLNVASQINQVLNSN